MSGTEAEYELEYIKLMLDTFKVPRVPLTQGITNMQVYNRLYAFLVAQKKENAK